MEAGLHHHYLHQHQYHLRQHYHDHDDWLAIANRNCSQCNEEFPDDHSSLLADESPASDSKKVDLKGLKKEKDEESRLRMKSSGEDSQVVGRCSNEETREERGGIRSRDHTRRSTRLRLSYIA